MYHVTEVPIIYCSCLCAGPVYVNGPINEGCLRWTDLKDDDELISELVSMIRVFKYISNITEPPDLGYWSSHNLTGYLIAFSNGLFPLI